jgi:broad specificity phosphatase PhoE
MPALAASDADFAKLVDAFRAEMGGPDRNRRFQRMFEVLMDAWEQGTIADDAVEPFDRFAERVRSALESITSSGGRGTIAVFTSGGPIGACVQTVLDAPRRAALRLNWRVKNASMTELIFSRGRISLESFNSAGHLAPTLRSFR